MLASGKRRSIIVTVALQDSIFFSYRASVKQSPHSLYDKRNECNYKVPFLTKKESIVFNGD